MIFFAGIFYVIFTACMSNALPPYVHPTSKEQHEQTNNP